MPVSSWSSYKLAVDLSSAAGVVYSSAVLMCNSLTVYLKEESPERGGRQILRLSLTMPEWESSPVRIREYARLLASTLATEPGCGAWLALDVTEEGREHLYGIAVTNLAKTAIQDAWVTISGATADGCQVRPVTGQKNGWGLGSKSSGREKLGKNLGRVLHYGLKTLLPRYAMAESERVFTSGCLRILWERAVEPPSTGQPSQQPRNSDAEPSNPSAHSVRCCQRCGGRMVATARRHAHWCSASCRTLAYKIRRQVRQGLSHEELEAFEERAAILEYEAGCTRTRAEQLAHDGLMLARRSTVPKSLPMAAVRLAS